MTTPRPSFWSQPCRWYRNFQIVYAILAVQFIAAATVYVIAPDFAAAEFSRISERLGGGPFETPEAFLWRYLGAANVMTLGLMCLLLMRSLRRNFAILTPLCFLKGFNAALFLAGYLFENFNIAFLAVFLFDGVTCALFVIFARGAHRAIASLDDARLVPRPK